MPEAPGPVQRSDRAPSSETGAKPSKPEPVDWQARSQGLERALKAADHALKAADHGLSVLLEWGSKPEGEASYRRTSALLHGRTMHNVVRQALSLGLPDEEGEERHGE